MVGIDESKRRRRRGPAPLDAMDKRVHTVSVRLNPAELAQLDRRRATVRMQRGEYLRTAGLHRLPPTIPAINREAWAALARAISNLNQYQRVINAGLGEAPAGVDLADLRDQVQALRRGLIGLSEASARGVGDEGED